MKNYKIAYVVISYILHTGPWLCYFDFQLFPLTFSQQGFPDVALAETFFLVTCPAVLLVKCRFVTLPGPIQPFCQVPLSRECLPLIFALLLFCHLPSTEYLNIWGFSSVCIVILEKGAFLNFSTLCRKLSSPRRRRPVQTPLTQLP